jgi:hypothetical protein
VLRGSDEGDIDNAQQSGYSTETKERDSETGGKH